MKRMILLVLVTTLFVMGCAAPRHEYYRKEFSIEVRENDLTFDGQPSPSIVAKFKIHN